MIGGLHSCTIAIVLALATTSIAAAHPHVFVTAKVELVFGSSGALQSIRYAWTFDEMFSAFTSQGLDKNNDGKLSQSETAELAKSNIESLKDLNYFTRIKTVGKRIEFGEPAGYFFDTDDKNNLVLHFTLPVKAISPKAGLSIEVYDPKYFVAFSFAEGNPVSLSNAPRGCSVKVTAPHRSLFLANCRPVLILAPNLRLRLMCGVSK